jgi:hypothetical protein
MQLERREEKHIAIMLQVVLQLKHEENGEYSDWVFASTMTYGRRKRQGPYVQQQIHTSAGIYCCHNARRQSPTQPTHYHLHLLLIDHWHDPIQSHPNPNHGERWTRCGNVASFRLMGSIYLYHLLRAEGT